jgi:uncharacterized protein involved in exopolysaccharide biosynthesis
MNETKWESRSEEVSIFAVGTLLLRDRWRIARWALAGAAIALGLAWTRPALYQGSASFIPQGADPARSGLASLAGQFGVSLSSSSQALTPEFYLQLITSREVLSSIVRDTLVVPEVGGKRIGVEDLLHIGAEPTKAREEAAVKELARRVNASTSKTTGIVEFTVGTEWPSVSLAITTALVDGVNAFDERTRHDQAASERKFIEGRLVVAAADLRAAEDRLQQFLESNRQVKAPDLQLAQDRMQRDVSMRQQVYTTLTQAYDDVRMRELRDTPVITMVDEPSVPAKPESRGRGIRTLVGFLIGAAIGALIAFIGDLAAKRRANGDLAAKEFASTVEQVKGSVTRSLRRVGRRASAS